MANHAHSTAHPGAGKTPCSPSIALHNSAHHSAWAAIVRSGQDAAFVQMANIAA